MYKPKIIGNTLYNGFSEQEKQVSISVDAFDFSDSSPYRVFYQLEPNEIVNTEQKLIDNHAFYDLILTWNERVLEACSKNSSLCLYGTCSWAVDPKDHANVKSKKFSVSYLTSSKVMCYGHKFRHEVYGRLPEKVGDLLVTRHMSPPVLECKIPLLYPFQFSIIMENARRSNWITEKIIDCLVSRTVPIYWGAPNVGKFFNEDSILSFETYDELVRVLEGITPEFYREHLSAIDENFHEAMKYTNIHARIDEEIRRRLSDSTRTPSTQRPSEAICQRMFRRKPFI